MEMQIDGKDISSLRVVDLKAQLEKRGQSKAGTKKDLTERLINYLKTHPGKPQLITFSTLRTFTRVKYI
jgi:hypothetical protein